MLSFLQHGWRNFIRELEELRGAPFVALLLVLCGLLLATPQGADLIVTSASDDVQRFWLVAAALIYGLQCWFWTRLIIEQRALRSEVAWQDNALKVWTPRLLGAGPFLWAALAVVRAHTPHQELAWILLALALVMVSGLWVRRSVLHAIGVEAGPRVSLWFRVGSLAGAAALMALFTLAPVGPAQALGAVGVVYLGLAGITAVLAQALNASRESRLPIFGGLLILACVLSFFVDNHEIGRRAFGRSHAPPLSSAELAALPSVEDALKDWCARQPSQCKDPKAPTPIVFVAAQGGASRAGYWAADVLGQLQSDSQAQGRFSDHVFAISSVSGGSVGSLAYLSALHDEPNLAHDAFRQSIADASGRDFLSPAIAGLLFPDLLQRFLPFAVLPDRAETLERGFEQGWAAHCSPGVRCADPDLWSKPLLSLWSHNAGWVPALLINGARQEDGRRIITSNLKIDPHVFPDAVDFHALTGRDVDISTAVTNGARFPLVSPGGTLTDAAHATFGHLLDGGYFDGGGVATVADLATEVMRVARQDQYALHPIFIELDNGADTPVCSAELVRDPNASLAALAPSKSDNLLIDILGPLDGLSQARGAHGLAAAQALSFSVERGDFFGGQPNHDYYLIHLCDGTGRKVPMDWALSAEARTTADNALTAAADKPCDVAGQLAAIISALKPPSPAAAPASPAAAASPTRPG